MALAAACFASFLDLPVPTAKKVKYLCIPSSKVFTK
jgi:hypothetical protein